MYSAQIRAFLRHERETLEFDVANLHFSMCKLSDAGHALIYFLQIEAKEKQPLEPKLSAIEQDYQIIHELSESLNLLSHAGELNFQSMCSRKFAINICRKSKSAGNNCRIPASSCVWKSSNPIWKTC